MHAKVLKKRIIFAKKSNVIDGKKVELSPNIIHHLGEFLHPHQKGFGGS